MQLGLLIYGSLETISGGYLYDRKLVEHLRSAGDEVEVISLPWRSYAHSLADNFSPGLYQHLRRFTGEILLQDELNHPSLFLLNHRLKTDCKYHLVSIVHHLRCLEHRPAWQNRFYRQVEHRYLNSLDGFIFNSQTTRQTVAEFGINLTTIPNLVAAPGGDNFDPFEVSSITSDEIQRRSAEPAPLRLVFLGNLIPRKGLHTLLEALAKLPAESCRLTIIGNQLLDKGYTQFVSARIRALGLEARVRILGALSGTRLAEELHQGQILVVPSHYEGFGIVYLEGMGFGLPAIATTAGAAWEIISEGEDGFLIPPGDVGTLTDRLGKLAQDRRLLAEMSLAARRRFERQPGWEKTCASVRKFLINLTRSDH